MSPLSTKIQKEIHQFHQKHPDIHQVLMVGPLLKDFTKDWPFERSGLSRSHSSPPLVLFVDGGIEQKSSLLKSLKEWGGWENLPLHLCVGDADSADEDSKDQFDFLFHPEKEASDLSLALEFLPFQTHFLEMWGFIGGRLDHQMIVLGELSRWLEGQNDQTQGQLLDLSDSENATLKFVSAGEIEFIHHGLFSVMSLIPNNVQIEGDCEYPLLRQTKLGTLSSLGLSNRAQGTVKLQTSGPSFVYLYHGEEPG